jgi:hypothetical protein
MMAYLKTCNMKQTRYLLLICLLLTACGKSFLDISPEQFQKEGNYFKTADQFVQALNGAYAPLQGLYTGSHWVMTEMRSDNTSYQKNTGDASGFAREELEYRAGSLNRRYHRWDHKNAGYRAGQLSAGFLLL